MVVVGQRQAFEIYVKNRIFQIENNLESLLQKPGTLPYKQLFEAAKYSVLNGGKRLRPILAIAVAEALGGSLEAAMHPACALEMIHTYSLIHDDLPCMDNDDFRRGKPSLHRAYPEGLAVLVGDFLLTYAFEILAAAPGISSDRKLRLIALLSRQAGGEGMIAGQVMDLDAEGKQIVFEELQHIHSKKTGALMIAAVEFGGIVAGATDEQQRNLRRFGQELGLAFQIRDDILDVTASVEKHGKARSSDKENNKATYVSLLGLEKAKQALNESIEASKKALNALALEDNRLMDLTMHTLTLTYEVDNKE
jgi:geranylgeranyl diphosphate synthase type II